MTAEDAPIGYWLKRLDELIDASFERALGEHGVSRRQWQVMNVLRDTATDVPALADALRPFVGDDFRGLEAAVGELAQRGWITPERDGKWAQTPLGRETYARLAERVHETRRILVTGVSEDEYRRTVDVLRRMEHNVEDFLARR